MTLMELLSVDVFGYLAGFFLLLMASMKSQTHMRICNIAGNVCFIAYGFLGGLMPVLILNTIILALHAWRLIQSRLKSDAVAA